MSVTGAAPDPIPFGFVTPDTPLLYEPKAAAKKLGVHPDTLAKWRKHGLISPRKPLPGETTILYSIFDLMRFAESMGLG